ncbi:MAG: carboxypeptidase regulatory-like domain-containing protein [Acidobacteria bacterium]|nr:carboxypeptidase regulatory-like domain-containing protein [Acidobacteriota bacterium]
MRIQHLTLAVLAVAVSFPVARVLQAQSTQSSILGAVADASASPVPGATVTVRNEGTNFTRTIQTDASGDYRVSGLEAGFYQVTVAATGFKTFSQTRIDLASSQIKRIDAKLEVGELSTTVTVEGGVSQVETETVTLSNLKTSRDFAQLPMSVFGRGWANITNVTAGVQSASGFEVNGARDTANNFTSDGISVNDMISSRNTANGFSGDIETFQEIKILTANSSAEYPQVAQFAAISKSGSNEPHGALYWGIFNSNFSARSWADRQAPSFTNHNMFAVNGGGPVYIPRLYDGRDRTFFFASYSGARYRIGNRMLLSVPTPQMRQGDFSALAGKINLVDSLSGQPFPNNVLPASRLSSVSKTVQDLLYPDPNQPGLGTYGMTNNFYADPGGRFDSDVYSFRVDHKLSGKNLLFARVGLTINNKDTYLGPLKNGYGQSSIRSNIPGRSVVISDTHTFTPALVNEVKLGFNRTYQRRADTNFGQEVLSKLGIQGIENPGNDPAISGMPGFSFGGAIPIAGTAGRNDSYSAQNTYQAIDNLSWYRGRHNFKFGVDIRRLQVNSQDKPLFLRGTYAFDDRLTGLAYSNFLLGWPGSATRGVARPNAYPRSTHAGFYWQDDFKVSSRITLNFGLRYEYQTPWVEKFDRIFTFDSKTGSMVTAGTSVPTDLVPKVAATLPIISASQAGLPTRSLMNPDRNNWSPRFGLAIRPLGDATTVVRLGYGLYSQFWPGLLALNATGGPWQSTESFILENPSVPSIQFPSPFRTTSAFSGIQAISGVSANFPNERTHQWNVSIGRQVWGTAIDIGYVGTRSLNIPYNEDLNLLRPSTQPFSAARRPYPRFNSANLIQTGGSSMYHGLTIQADRRMTRGLWFNANYTWAKALTDTDLRGYPAGIQQNQYERYLERSDDGNLRRQQLRFSYVYDLPFGRGRRFLSRMPVVVNYILGGWQLAGITTMQTGARLSPAYSNAEPANTNQFSGRPDRLGDGSFGGDGMADRIRSRQPVFDLGAFRLPATGRGFYGNSARYILTGPGEATWNTGVHKNWKVAGERAQLQFRWEAHNAFNRVNFNNPNTNIQSGSFGLVTTAGSGRSMLFGLRLDF